MLLRRWLQIGVGVLFAGIILGYASFQFQDWLAGPTIRITTPMDGQTLSEPMVEIAGSAKRIAYLSLNGRQIYTNPQGEFDEKLVLSPGYNIITVSAEDKFNRTTEKQLELVLSATSTDLQLPYGQE
jgi:hypothetical protein